MIVDQANAPVSGETLAPGDAAFWTAGAANHLPRTDRTPYPGWRKGAKNA